MTDLTIRTINSVFFSTAQAAPGCLVDDAMAEGVRGALMIATDEIRAGASAAAVEVIIDDDTGTPMRRAAVSVSVASLAVGPIEQRVVGNENN